MPSDSPLPTLLARPERLGPERTTLRRLASALEELLRPTVPDPEKTLAGAYRHKSGPTNMLRLLDYIDELLNERELDRAFYVQSVQALLHTWQAERAGGTESPFFDLTCRELTGQPLPAATAHPVPLLTDS